MRWHASLPFPFCAYSLAFFTRRFQTQWQWERTWKKWGSNDAFKTDLLFFNSNLSFFTIQWQYQTESKGVIWFVIYFCQKCFSASVRLLLFSICINVVYICFTKSPTMNNKIKMSLFLWVIPFVHLPGIFCSFQVHNANLMDVSLVSCVGKQKLTFFLWSQTNLKWFVDVDIDVMQPKKK